MCNYCDMWPSMGEWWYCGMLDKFLLGNVLCLRTRKNIYFHFYLMFPNIKKVKILTPIISNETMQSNLKCIQQITSPFSFAALYNCRINTEELKDVSGWKISCVYKKQTKKTPQHHAEQLLLGVWKSIYKLVILLRRHMGLQFYLSNFIQLPHREHKWGSQHCNLWRAERVDTFCYL